MANYTDFAGSVAQDLAGDVLQVKEVEHRYAQGILQELMLLFWI